MRTSARMNKQLRLILLLPIFIGFLFFSCEGPELENTCTDPIGSDELVLRDESFFCFSETFDGCFNVSLSSSDATVSAISLMNSSIALITDVGPVACLGEINSKPLTGYDSSALLIEKHGYVVMLADSTFGRFFVDMFVPVTGGGISEVNILWHYTF